MKKLDVEDLGNFARLIKLSGARHVISDMFAASRKAASDRRKCLFDLQQAAAAGDAFAAQEYDLLIKDEDWLTVIGINEFLAVMDCAAENGVMDAVYKFLAPIFECSANDVRKMPLPDFIAQITQLIKTNDMASFFGAARKMGIL